MERKEKAEEEPRATEREAASKHENECANEAGKAKNEAVMAATNSTTEAARPAEAQQKQGRNEQEGTSRTRTPDARAVVAARVQAPAAADRHALYPTDEHDYLPTCRTEPTGSTEFTGSTEPTSNGGAW
ncbi:hypothetical protein DCS_05477 [Drechmeria coniospora]|uniref:Uncharacterized protein n=1 Tax=Drechmeria coniospora TaxID=98403 RepID=A0A151GN50_DRECN|nr:hypothetical protein DCS_05477 [Drechmeria coniospora]KYK58461.1 hypothetical protein DCS_05477 [Drechmeria coniospora]